MALIRRACAVWMSLLGVLLLARPAVAQSPLASEPVLPGSITADDPQQHRGRLPGVLASVPAALQDKQWQEVAHALHMLLDAPPDLLVPVRQKAPGGEEYTHWFSPHA